MRASLLLPALMISASCGGASYVRVDDVALGKVVVYRNGIAYYERRAHVVGDELRLMVPRDKVDDFLKSLTVTDATTGKPLNVGFSRDEDHAGGVVDMTISLPKQRSAEVVLTYITESPAWKPSYRVVAEGDGKVMLESWAVVDNTSAETWKDVLIGVGSSSALSFRFDLWSVRNVARETLHSAERLAIAPPTGASPHGGEKSSRLVAQFDDDSIPRAKTHPTSTEYALAEAPPAIPGRSFSGDDQTEARAKPSKEQQRRTAIRLQQRRRMLAKKKASDARVRTLAASLKKSRKTVTINGYARSGEQNADSAGLDRANSLRNRLIEEGVAPGQLRANSEGYVKGRNGGVALVAAAGGRPGLGTAAGPTQGDGQPVGESHFESKSPMTVRHGSSVMVSMIKKRTPGEVIYYYDAESERGNKRFPFKAIRFKNPTGHTLEGGPVTVYSTAGFIGEGLTESIPPRSIGIIPFALDRRVVVNRENHKRDRISKLVTLSRGVLTAEVTHTRATTLNVSSRIGKPVTVYLKHTVGRGWNLGKAPKHVERLGDAHLFRIELGAHETRKVVIEETTPMRKTLDLRTDGAVSMVKLYLGDISADSAIAKQLGEVVALRKSIATHEMSIASRRTRLGDYRTRMGELHAQIVTLKVVREGGSLLRHLKTKMKAISERVQKATIALVDEEESLMLARVRFQDAVAELSLGSPAVVAARHQ